MERHWAEGYVGVPYSECDCAQLAVQVQKEWFNRIIGLPAGRPDGIRSVSNLIHDLQADFATQVGVPEEGDAVLMIGRGRINHIGTVCFINGREHVLHAMKNVGMTCLHRTPSLRHVGLTVEGYYRWK